jgi:prophage regulatory protein
METNVESDKVMQLTKDALVKQSQLIRIDEVSALTTLAKSSINLWVSQSKFPRPIILAPTIKVWKLIDITEWINTKYSTSSKIISHKNHGDFL